VGFQRLRRIPDYNIQRRLPERDAVHCDNSEKLSVATSIFLLH
jgi:hypothetical protein